MSYQLIQASANAIPLADETVQTCVTSPPYWGLREYAGEQEFVWGGDAEHAHEWGEMQRGRRADLLPADVTTSTGRIGTTDRQDQAGLSGGHFCPCGAWRGALGLEPTPELYVEHMVAVFREVRRVLRPDGTLWLNLGDSYAGSWGNQGRKEERGTQRPINGEMLTPVQDGRYPSKQSNTGTPPPGLKPKDLVGIPWRVAFALQADGWYLRSDIIWAKPNPMPESVTDRPTKAHEYIFLLSKNPRYYFAADAVRESVTGGSHARSDGVNPKAAVNEPGAKQNASFSAAVSGIVSSRNIRTVWDIATQPYAGAHFATFPEAIPERCIKAGSAIGDLVLDPFNGSGTTGRVAVSLGRDYVGLDTSEEYLHMALERVDPLAAAGRDARTGTSDQGVMAL